MNQGFFIDLLHSIQLFPNFVSKEKIMENTTIKKDRKVKYDIKDRLQTYLRTIGMSINKLETVSGLTNRYLNNVHFLVPIDKVQMILDVLPDLNSEWLLQGTGEMTNNPLRATSPAGINNREAVLFRLEEVLRANGFRDLHEYEVVSQRRKGNIENNILEGDDRLVVSTVFSVVGNYTDFSMDWVLYGQGTMRIGAMMYVPIVSVSSLYMDDSGKDGWYVYPETAVLVPAPSHLVPDLTDSARSWEGFIFVVPDMGGHKRSVGDGVTDDDVRPAFANSTQIRLYPGDALLCERFAGNLDKGSPYLFYISNLEMVACALFEDAGFRVDEPASDYFGARYRYFDAGNVVVLGRVSRKMTSRLDG